MLKHVVVFLVNCSCDVHLSLLSFRTASLNFSSLYCIGERGDIEKGCTSLPITTASILLIWVSLVLVFVVAVAKSEVFLPSSSHKKLRASCKQLLDASISVACENTVSDLTRLNACRSCSAGAKKIAQNTENSIQGHTLPLCCI